MFGPDGDGGADIGPEIEQAFDGQAAQRIADRRPADAEFARKLGLLQAETGRQTAIENALAQLCVGVLGGRMGRSVCLFPHRRLSFCAASESLAWRRTRPS